MPFNDVTEKLKTSAASLVVGQMVSSNEFSLEDAMSAIELMEPKMDPGCDLSKNEAGLRSVRARINSTKLSDEGATQSADILLELLFNWLSGHMYVQTVHASFYMTERENLPNADLGAFSQDLLRLCSLIRNFIVSTELSDEEDFIGHMFGLADDSIQDRASSPQLSSVSLDLRRQFVAELMELTGGAIAGEDNIVSCIDCLVSTLGMMSETTSPSLSPDEQELLDASVDPKMHRNLLPPGPPRVIPAVSGSLATFLKWRDLLGSLKSALLRLDNSEALLSPFSLVAVLGEIRRSSGFSSTFLRAFLYKQIVLRFPFQSIAQSWLETCCGGTLKPLMKQFKEETDAFVQDSALVLNRVVYALCRTASRQHRSLKHTLDDLCVLQHRGWDLCMKAGKSKLPTGFNPKGLWAFTAVMGCCMIELNLLLCVELGLVDFETDEIALILFLIESTASVKVYVLNELLGTMRTASSVDAALANELRKHTAHAALEHAFASSGFRACVVANNKAVRSPEEMEQLERLFELRSAPLRTFPLPKNVSLDDFLEKSSEDAPLGADDVIAWADRISSLFTSTESVLLGSNLDVVKETVLNNKLMMLKKGPDTKFRLTTKYHWIVPCLAL